ncbi:MAG TPA: VWA domain-containing protein [Candidatus Sulfotelmatobacter sp.]|nr:VWA domain-containing protein [Candidatus Sulfotelmatobacter sp.]
MGLRGYYWAWLALLLLTAASLDSQTSTPDSASAVPAFKAEARLVLLDVVVTNGKGEPVPGLRQEDFQVVEDGKPQRISLFEEHRGAAPIPAKLSPMPANVFTNYPITKTPDSVNVLLLDWLNTQPPDQVYVRAQTIHYLKSVPPGASLAVFTLGSRLHMVQGFTTDPAVLLAALDNKKSGPGVQPSRLLDTATQAAAEQDVMKLMIMNQAAPAAIEAVRQEMASTAALHTDDRVSLTLQALQQLARYLSGMPGRKNVIWFSGSFPISIFPGAGGPREYQGEIRQTADLLTPGRVAIYPVSAAGLAGDATYYAEYAQGPPIAEENARRAENQLAMEQLARDTGGLALYNTNGLSDAMAHAINSGSHYYGLAYSPTDKKMNGKYRAIQVKLVHGEYKLAYRRGYYAEKDKTGPGANQEAERQKADDHLLTLMRFGLPDSTQVVYKVTVLPTDPQPAADATRAGANTEIKGPVTRYAVDYAIMAQDLALKTTPDGVRHGSVEAMLLAYDLEGKALNYVAGKFEIALPPKVYAEMEKMGLPLRQEIDVPAGHVYLRTGIYDLGGGSVGTLGIPLSAVSRNAAAAK